MFFSRIARIMCAGATLLFGGSAIVAQDAGLQLTDVKGKLVAAAGQQLQIMTEDGQMTMAVLDPRRSSVEYSGTAELPFLMTRPLVRFTTKLNNPGTPQDPISELVIFNVVRTRRMSAQQIQNQTPGIYPQKDDEEDGTKDDPKADKDAGQKSGSPKSTGKQSAEDRRSQRQKSNNTPRSAGNSNTPNAAGVSSYLVVGKVMAVRTGMIQVAAGNRPMQFAIAPDATITIESRGMSFAMPGDEVEISGLSQANQPNLIQAEKIKISGANPLGKMPDPQQLKNNGNAKEPSKGEDADGKSQGDPKTTKRQRKK